MRKKIVIALFAFVCGLNAVDSNKDTAQKVDLKCVDLEEACFNVLSSEDLLGYEAYKAERSRCPTVYKAFKFVGEAACETKKCASKSWDFTTRKIDKCVSVFFDYAAQGVVKFGGFATNFVVKVIDLI